MNEDALRAIVRETIARMSARDSDDAPRLFDPPSAGAPHPSAFLYTLPPSDGPCLIEPGVPCNHCGYCQTHGH